MKRVLMLGAMAFAFVSFAAPRTGPPQPASFLVGTGTGPGNVAQRGPRHPTARH